MELIISSQRGRMSHGLISSALCGLPLSAGYIGRRRLQARTGNYICLLNMSHIINILTDLTRPPHLEPSAGKRAHSPSYGFIRPGLLQWNLSPSGSMHVSQLMGDRLVIKALLNGTFKTASPGHCSLSCSSTQMKTRSVTARLIRVIRARPGP